MSEPGDRGETLREIWTRLKAGRPYTNEDHFVVLRNMRRVAKELLDILRNLVVLSALRYVAIQADSTFADALAAIGGIVLVIYCVSYLGEALHHLRVLDIRPRWGARILIGALSFGAMACAAAWVIYLPDLIDKLHLTRSN